MIASVVLTLDVSQRPAEETLAEIGKRQDIEVGDVVGESNRVPLTIESNSRQGMTEATAWLQELTGSMFVDVVFVHFEEESGVG